MANKTVYVKESDLHLWDKVQIELGENVSSLLMDCMKRRLRAGTLEFSRNERLILLNQFRILAILDPRGENDYQTIETALRRGYTSEYEELFGMSVADEMPTALAAEVRDTLDLFRMLKVSYRDMPLNDLSEEEFHFQGFDGNNESAQFGYAAYLIEQRGRWIESKSSPLNSHEKKLPKYRRMIAAWRQCTDKWHPKETEVRTIIDAGTGF